jgi:peptide chain release factor subunit 1
MLQKMDSCYALEKQSTVPSSTALLLEPPKKLMAAYYKCDSKFHLDSILEMFEEEEKIGVCLISGKELIIYTLTLSGSHVDYNVIKRVDIILANKHNKGGQSSNRFGRIVQIVRNNYVDIIVDNIISAYMCDNNTKCLVSNIVLAGPGEMKKNVSETAQFKQYFSKYLHKILPTDTFHDKTIYEITDDIIHGVKCNSVKDIDNEINNLIQYKYDSLTFGESECIQGLKENNIKKLFVNKCEVSDDVKLFENSKTEIIMTSSNILKTYGNWIGVKWYNSIDQDNILQDHIEQNGEITQSEPY